MSSSVDSALECSSIILLDIFCRFLVDNGVPSDRLGWYLTRNPFILKEDLGNLGLRLEYLSMKKFTDNEIERIINVNPYWLSFR